MTSVIHCENLSKSYGSKKALHEVNFEVSAGAPIALVGPNGAGKTTLFGILCGYYPASTGTATVFGEKPGSSKLFGRLAALPQDALLDPKFSVGQQLRYFGRLQGMSLSQQRIETERCLELVGLTECSSMRPGELSHGMRKRIAIAQALLGNPELVLLDEATAGLDPANARQVRDLIADLSTDITFILSSHDMHELEQLCHSVLFLNQGRLSHQSVSRKSSEDTLTLRMRHCGENIAEELQALHGMLSVDRRPQNEFILNFDPAEAADIPVRILTLCKEKEWAFSQLSVGKTLENQLFSGESSEQ